jgi:Concanavalin A-like lectin/glucanases superfamily/Fibronectin type III domain
MAIRVRMAGRFQGRGLVWAPVAALPAALLIMAPASPAGASAVAATAAGQPSVSSSRTVNPRHTAAGTAGAGLSRTKHSTQATPGARQAPGQARTRAVPRPAGAPLSAAWRHAYHPRHASKGVLALRGEPLRSSVRPGTVQVPWQRESAFFRPAPAGSRVELRPLQCTLPTAPGSVTATAGANQAAVTWTAANGNGNTITAYVLREATGPQTGASIATGGGATSATLTGLAGGTAATFSVVAETSCGTGPAGTSGSATPTGSATTYVSAVQSSSPVAFYRLAEPAATTVMADSSGNAADGAYSGQGTLGEPAALLNDPATTANYTSCCSGIGTGNSALPKYNGARTVEAWFDTTSGTTNMALAGYGTTTTNEAFIVSLSAHSVNVDTYNDYLSFPTPRPANDGNWHMVAVTYNGTNAVVYLDGQQIGSAPFAGAVNTQNPAGLQVGYFSGYNPFNGDEADVAAFGSALGATTVASQFAASGYSVPTAPKVVNVFTGGANAADVTWGHATAGGGVQAYLVSALGGVGTPSVAVSGDATAARVTGLAAGTYTFQVVAMNPYGSGPAASTKSFTVTGTASTYVSTVLSSTPSVFYRMGDSTLSAMSDSSGNGGTGAYTSSHTTLGQTGPLAADPATAISDPGCCTTAAGASPALPLYASPRTLEAWVNTTSTGEQFVAGYGETNTSEGFDVVVEPHAVIVSGYSDDLSFTSPAAIDDGSWHFVAATTNGTSATVYVDGKNLGTQNFPVALNTVTAPQGLVVGMGPEDCCGYFTGHLADLAVFPTALAGATVTAQFAASGLGTASAPGSPAATAGANQATVSWTAPGTADPAVTGYLVTAFAGTTAGNTLSVPATATSAVVTGLEGGTAYTFQIQALNEYGAGTAATTAAVTPTGTASTYDSTTQGDGPSVFYRMADTDAQALTDSSGNGATGAYTTNATLAEPGPLASDPATAINDAGCCNFAASGNPTLPLYSQPRTLEGWIKTTAGGTQYVAGYGTNSTDEGFDLLVQPNAVIASGYSDDLSFATPAAINDGSWHFVVVTTTGSAATVYLDGVSLGTQNFPATLDTLAASQGLVAGMGAEDCCGYFTGGLADLAVFPSALTAAQVTAQFAASGLSVPGAPTAPSATAGANQASVSWTAPAASDPAVSGYLVTAYKGTTAGSAVSVPATVTSTVVTGLVGGTAYKFKIQALNEYGAGPAATTAAVTPTGAASTYVSTVLSASPSVFYRLADTDQHAMADSSGHGATGSYTSNATLGEPGPLASDPVTAIADAGCCTFAASGDASLPLYASPRSMEAWINTTSTNEQFLAGYGVNNTQQGFNLIVEPHAVIVSGYNDDLTFTSSAALNDGAWHFVVATTTGTAATVYVDGVSLGTQNFGAALNTLPASQGLVIGMGTEDCCGYYTGDVADLAVFPAALTATQVTNEFTASGLGRATAPTSPSATAGANQATVSWTAPPQSNPAYTGFLVTAYKGSTAANAVTVPATATSATVTGLAGGTAYTFKIAALNEYGAGATATTAAVTPTGAASTYVSTVLSSKPSVFYRLADTDTHAMADSSGNGATGGAYGSTTTLGQTGPLANDTATGASDTGCCSQLASGNPTLPLYASARTMEAWVNTTSGGEEYVAGYGSTSTTEAFNLATQPDSVIVSGYNDDLSFNTKSPINDGSWHFIAVTATATSATVYVDGNSLGTQNFPSPLDTLPATQGLVLGMLSQDCCGYFSGDLADVAVFPSALSATAVSAQFAASGLGVPGAPTSPAATAGANQATVSWVGPAGSDPAVSGYLVTAMQGSTPVNSVSVPATASGTTVTGLAGSTAYTFHIQALNEYGASPAATTASVTTTGTATTYDSTVLSDNPSVFYRLADTDSHAMADSSGNGATGSYTSNATLGQTGPLAGDNATSISDSGCCQAAADGNPSLPLYNSSRSFEGWIKTTNGGEEYLGGYGSTSTSEGFIVATEPNNVIVSGYSDDLSFTTTTTLDNGNWHFIVVTTNGTSATVYVDGTSQGTQTFPTPLDTVPAPQGLAIGMGSQDCCGYFSGNLADIAVFPSALTASQVTAQYTASGVGGGKKHRPKHITVPVNHPAPGTTSPNPHSRPARSPVTGGRS